MTKRHIRFLLLSVLFMAPSFARAQASFDPGEGCLNVIDFSFGQRLGKYGDRCISASYLHERFIDEHFSIGGGVGYSHHGRYDFSAVPIFLSAHCFFLDRRFSPFVNLRVGGFVMAGKNNVDTYQEYSLSGKSADFNLYVSPSVGIKAHVTPNIGIIASVGDEVYLLKAFDTGRNDYHSKLAHSLSVSLGVCFQIDGW